jgi:hypothetical protein
MSDRNRPLAPNYEANCRHFNIFGPKDWTLFEPFGLVALNFDTLLDTSVEPDPLCRFVQELHERIGAHHKMPPSHSPIGMPPIEPVVVGPVEPRTRRRSG